MNIHTLSRLVYEEILRCHLHPNEVLDPNYLSVLTGIRSLLIQSGDPLIHMPVGKIELQMNLSHQLPLLRTLFPLYDTILPRIASLTLQHEQYLKVIDVGANIGDTATSIWHETGGDFLCIEGDAHYFSLLQENVKPMHDHMVCVNAICGERDCYEQGYMKTEHGTGHFLVNSNMGKVQLTTLNTLVKTHPCFCDANLLKVDTDGFDTCVLRGAQDFLSNAKPTIFFEYVPALIVRNGDDPFAIFTYLTSLGYQYALFYTNLGVAVEIVDISDHQRVAALAARIDNVNVGYYDILLPSHRLCHEHFIAFCQHEIAITHTTPIR